jgi:hypothetical protein
MKMLWKLGVTRKKDNKNNEDVMKVWINKKERTTKKNKNVMKD